ncbi:hypothetical protein [Budvicia aquatica]|uniref:Uncharacterized protein n=1 Tax=Budvicia aquatica TaxID=82979 RepID=A0A2C6DL42_9GAMM|nr:hypothetical protein [Budvicia aquatica]PHI29175.1 hypothetical protein CRN84_07495 [Budvicia aquatica]VFS47365.1 Uncharacterised protein [Budvicia aquatica]
MNMTVMLFIVACVALCFFYVPYAKKQRARAYGKLSARLDDPNTVRVALWINLEKVNGEVFTGEYHYWTAIKKAVLNPDPVGVALFEPGTYDFTVSSNTDHKYQNVNMQVEMLPGETYQLGCNADGPYLVIDPEPARYDYKK